MEENNPHRTVPNFQSIEEFTKNGFKILVEATKVANALPTDRDWDFYKVYNSFNKIVNTEGDKLLHLMNNIIHSQDLTGNIIYKDTEEKTEMIIEANDNILEKVVTGIDELNGIRKTCEPIEIQTVSAQLPVNGSWNQLNKATFVVNSINSLAEAKNASLKSITLLTAKNITRPQTLFKDKIDNGNYHPWIPRIAAKSNSITPLALFLEETENGEQYMHPYEYELDHFKPPAGNLKTWMPLRPAPLENTLLHEITTPQQLDNLLKTLLKCTEFAVDLEHHSYRTFLGITCLMQISTYDADYLIDTLTLRDRLWILNEVFTKPTIVKVFHGADCDILWLQRDLSLYVVNMFDTHQAAKSLGYSGLSLAHLLHTLCDVVPNKHFQLADWRIRPLPEELKTYARMDTHYLLYIYHVLKNELLKKANGNTNILLSVLQQSTEICKKRYIKPILTEESHLELYRKSKRAFDNKQMYAFRELYQWRDGIARKEDESTGYVLPNHMLLQISDVLPREMQGILACCNPIPPLVRANLNHLHKIILKAREQSVGQPILKEDTRSRGSTVQFNKVNVDSPLNCPHDLSKSAEFRDDLPVLLTGNLLETINIEGGPIEKHKSMYSIFNTPDNSDTDECRDDLQIKILTFLGPYERYKLVKPFIEAEEAAEKKAAEEKGSTANDEPQSVELSNEDRIAALHAHFVQVSKEVPQIPTTEKAPQSETDGCETFVTMGGSKKRKHNFSDNEDEISTDNNKRHGNELHTPVPKWKQDNNQGRERNRRKGKKIQNQEQHNSNNSTTHDSAHTSVRPVEPDAGDKPQSRIKTRSSVQHKTPVLHVAPNGGESPTSRNKRKRQNQKRQSRQRHNSDPRDEYNSTPFDYSTVNYQQFQGGAGSSNQRQKNVNSNFKGKKKNKSNRNSYNKSMTFNRKANN